MPVPMTADRRRLPSRLSLLTCCTALVALAPISTLAQEVTVLAPIIVDGSDDDSSTVVAQGLSFGGKVGTDLLDTAGSISVITQKELRDRGVQSTEQALQYTAGVVTDFYGSDDRWDYFKIRGFNATTYRDGLRVGGSGQSANNLREDVFAYERVEVLKGADTTLFGVSDPGGMVNYVTKTPKTERFGEAYATVGSFSHKEAGVDFGDNLTPDSTLSYRVTARVQDADAEEDYSRDDGKLLMGGLSWRPSDATTVSVVADYLKSDGSTSAGLPFNTDLDRETFLGEPDFNYVGNERTSLSVMVDHDFGGGLTFSGNARYDDTASDFGMIFLSATPEEGTVIGRSFFSGDTRGHTFNADARLTYQTDLGSAHSTTTLGAQYVDTGYTAQGYYIATDAIDWTNPNYTGGLNESTLPFYNDARRSEETRAIYIQQQFDIADRFIISLGLRHDWTDIRQRVKTPTYLDDPEDPTDPNDVYARGPDGDFLINTARSEGDFSETTARVGLTYKITPELSAYATYAESAVPASTLTLDPETGKQYEIGVKYQPEAMRALFSAALFDLTKENITRTDASTGLQYLTGEIRSRGLELEARAEVMDGLELIAAYTYIDTEVQDELSGLQGNELEKVPNHLASLWSNYTLAGDGTRGDMTFGLGARYTGTYFNTAANTGGKSEAAVIYDAAVSYEVTPDTALSLNVKNLFDEQHDTGGSAVYYNPGREISATIRRTW
ncbi:TonB-dependent siderophore receptor [Falsirhodobacter sp. 20TX0035]|uniref:TonB-dependent siderophore receptor n=1 Tax=Falsirhodobacter sp. 20TX0035 TaxID=3022019 RepID=UPI00232D8116|nr:TonB-dependent receptor [Falsirhodobacter sp. 20TX0035]MDB6453038.1 TonB-dependent receptor [Falsirhodobacter sp. 20TX0035]